MISICFETGWDPSDAYELFMIDIYDILYRDVEYYPEGVVDYKRDFDDKRKMLRGKC